MPKGVPEVSKKPKVPVKYVSSSTPDSIQSDYSFKYSKILSFQCFLSYKILIRQILKPMNIKN